MARLNVNIDHAATVRQARRTFEPNLAHAAALAEIGGADGITIHLRGDRRHIQDDDIRMLRAVVKTHLNLEMAATDEMIEIAADLKPNTATLVPERPEEITTEGGLDVVSQKQQLSKAVQRLSQAGLPVSIFLDPVPTQIDAAAAIGATQIEICTSRYAELTDPTRPSSRDWVKDELSRISRSAKRAGELGLIIAAGHGLTYRNVRAIVEIDPVEELNIGHNIVARAVLVGIERATSEMIAAMRLRH
ncbi:MAG TPA: pyridoxine 5'-phosphate synthase [Blastocatellia bacterium]|nr:pyridoxine 5'-phosphate synthase [Blastocatellia bacterium]